MSFKKLKKRSLTSEMERNVKQMLKLIEEDGDSFAQKAEMYYKKRPELISLVEEFYRGYRTLAERYDQLVILDNNGSDPPSIWHPSSPRKTGRRLSTHRAAGFDFFLGSPASGNANGYYDAGHKDGDGSSTLTESDDESDVSSIHSYSGFFGGGGDHGGMNRRIMDLETELRGAKEKLIMHDLENNIGEDVKAKISGYEQELRNVKEKLRISEEEISKLKVEVEKYRSLELVNLKGGVESSSSSEEPQKTLEKECSIESLLEEEKRVTNEKLESSETQISSLRFEANKSGESIQQLQDQLNLAVKDVVSWKTRFNSEKRENTKLHKRLVMLRTSLADRDNEVRHLNNAVSNAEQAIFSEKAQLKSEISRLLEAQTHLEEEIRKTQSGKSEMEETLKGEIELLKEDIEERKNNIEDLNASLDALKLERDNLNAEVGSLKEEANSKDNKIESLEVYLNFLHVEHVQLVEGVEEAHKQVEELKLRAKQLEEENERQRDEILEGAEEKREAIRQLCFSLEHYRNGYNVLRQALVLAS